MLKNLRIEVDAHTHTVMSGHAWSTIQENCAAAAQKGMKALCMTDHGFCMKGTGTIWTPWSFSQLPDVIGGIRVYPGMEFNLWDTEGHLDEYLPGAFQHIRFGIASMHKNVMPVLDADAHTEAYIRAMDHACIDLIGVSYRPLLMATDRAGLSLRITFISTALLLGMQAALLPIYGTMGAASANIVAAIAGFVMMGLASRKAVRAQG